MATDPYSVFVCYRRSHRAFALEVRTLLRTLAGCQVTSDVDFQSTTASHRVQSRAHIRDSDCVVLVIPPDFKDWLATTDTELLKGFAAPGTPVMADEIAWVYERLAHSSKQLVVVVLEQRQQGGEWSPIPESLPQGLGELPLVIPSGTGDWREVLAEGIRRLGKLGPSIHVHENVRAAVEHVSKVAYEGWVGSPLLAQDSSQAPEFAYQPGLYVDLKGEKQGLQGEPASPQSGKGRVATLDPSIDVVTWILRGEYQEGWLVGEMGCGKTIALTRAAARSANDWLNWNNEDRDSDRHSAPPVPMLLSCASFYPREPEARARLTADDLVRAMSQALGTLAESFGTILSTRKCLILLDGLDDVEDPEALHRIRDAIIRLRETPSNFKVVVATRVPGPPAITVTEVLKIQAPSPAIRAELVNKIAQANPQFQFRIKQVLRDIQDRDANAGRRIYSTPLELAMACSFAQQADRPLNARFGELVQSQLDRAGGRSEHPETWRRALQAVALERMKHKSGILRDTARGVVSRVLGDSAAFLATQSGLLSLTGIIKALRPGGTKDIIEIETPFRQFLAAEAVATWSLDRITSEIPEGWTSVIKFVPGILARASLLDDACALIAELAKTAEQNRGSSEIWLSGLGSLVDHSALQVSREAHAFTLRAMDALEMATDWSLATRAEVLDACGLAARPYLQDILPSAQIRVSEIDKPGKCCYISNAPVLVNDYVRFLDDPDKESRDYWLGSRPSFVHEADEGAWYEQLRFPLRPVTGVTWHEARAYCRWLACQPGLEGSVVRLPTRLEWKAIARPGGQAREHPWDGDQGKFNYRGSGLNHPSPVGLFPAYCRDGLFDFGTNVYEWSGEGITDQGDVEVLGGTWKAFLPELRIDRSPIYCGIDLRRPDTGFRCVLERAELVAGERR